MSNEYLRFFKLSEDSLIINLVSEVLDNRKEAEMISVIMKERYRAKAYVRQTLLPEKYVVFADKVPYRFISSNYRKQYDDYIVATWL